MMFAEISRRL